MLADFACVREARLRDASALAGIFRDSWKLAYSGIIPHTHLTAMITRRGLPWWRDNLKKPRNVLVAEVSGRTAGYATFGPSRVPGRHRGEIYELYLAPEFQGLGMGERLFESTRQRLDDLRLDGLIIWALTENESACDFYWRRGGRPVATTTERFGGTAVPKTGFGWE